MTVRGNDLIDKSHSEAIEKLISVAGVEVARKGFLNLEKGKGKREKVLLSLDADSLKGESGEVEVAQLIHWNDIRGRRKSLSSAVGVIADKKVVRVSLEEYKDTKDDFDSFDVIEVVLDDDFSDLREMKKLCHENKKVRLTGGTILTLPDLGLRVGRKDTKGVNIFENGVYDDLKDVQFPEGVDRLVRSATSDSGGLNRGARREKRRRLGMRETGKRAF